MELSYALAMDKPKHEVIALAIEKILKENPLVARLQIDILEPKNPESPPEYNGLRVVNFIEIKTWTLFELEGNQDGIPSVTHEED